MLSSLKIVSPRPLTKPVISVSAFQLTLVILSVFFDSLSDSSKCIELAVPDPSIVIDIEAGGDGAILHFASKLPFTGPILSVKIVSKVDGSRNFASFKSDTQLLNFLGSVKKAKQLCKLAVKSKEPFRFIRISSISSKSLT